MSYYEKGYDRFARDAKNFTRSDLNGILDKERTFLEKSGMIGSLAGKSILVFQMIKDYISGKYKLSIGDALFLGAALTYLISPADAIPDMIPVFGYMDDIGVLSYAFYHCSNIISQYQKWKKNKE